METRKARATRRAAPAGAATETETDAAPARVTAARVGYAPIVRVDAARREIELCATSEALDSYGTVFDYAASKEAFTRWIGNVREMHERRAVGSRVSVRCDDMEHKIYVCARISRGAQDTWEKVLDGTLRGASIGASNVIWERQTRRVAGRERLLNVATHYDLVELSLVDNPSNPDALGITIVRDAVPDAAMLDDLTLDLSPRAEGETVSAPALGVGAPPAAPRLDPSPPEVPSREPETPPLPAVPPEPIPAPVPATLPPTPEHEPDKPDEANAPPEVHIARHAIAQGWASLRASDGSRSPAQKLETDEPECERACSDGSALRARGPFSANPEGYPDVGVPARAEERPTSALGARQDGNARARFHAAARGILMGCGCPLCVGALAALGETDMADGAMSARVLRDGGDGASAPHDAAIARALASGLSASVARMERMDESVRGLGDLLQVALSQMAGAASELRRRVETLEAQPLPGGPAAFAFDKSLALAPAGGQRYQPGPADQYRALESLAGKLTDPQAQIAVAAELIRLQRGE